MSIVGIAVRNVWRNKFRASLTVLGVGVAVLAFLMLRTILSAWMTGVEYAAKDRIGTRHRVTFILTLPKRYAEDIRNVSGVKAVTWANWFGGKHPTREKDFFATIAVDPKSFFEVFDEIDVSPDQKEQWFGDRRGALVGDVLAKQFGWKVGDRVTLTGTIYPGNWEFMIDGIYTAKKRSVDRSTFWFHWDYLNESLSDRMKDQVGWISSRIDDPAQAATIAERVDHMFAERDVQTLSMSERAMNTSFLGMLNAVLEAINFVSIIILLIMMLILGNTIAMGVRERTHEYGVLRAIGFLPQHLAVFVLGEAVVTGIVGGIVGVLLGYPFINQGVGRFLEENMGAYFPYFRVAEKDALISMALALVLGALAAAIPAYRVTRLNVTDALRRVG